MNAGGDDHLRELQSGTDDVVDVSGYREVESGADFDRSAIDDVRGDLAEVDVLLERIGPPARADLVPQVDVWVAFGLRKRWRVVSIGETYGEWDELVSAEMFINLLVDGNPDLRRLR